MLYAKVGKDENPNKKNKRAKRGTAGEDAIQETSMKKENKSKYVLLETLTWPKRIKENQNINIGGNNAGVSLDSLEI